MARHSGFGRHNSVPRGLAQAIAWLAAQAGVRKVHFGRVDRNRRRGAGAAGTLRVRDVTPAGLALDGVGGEAVLRLFVVADDPAALRAAVERRCPPRPA
jgi:hypothetical protein